MNHTVQELKNITRKLLDTPMESGQETVRDLSHFFQLFLTQENSYEEIIVDHGKALSTAQAASCVLDYKRTIQFIKGIYLAILDKKEKLPEETISILYAGSGPFGTLLVPLLPLFDPEELSVTFIDINQGSVNTLKQVIQKLDLENYVNNILLEDAINYQPPKDELPDIIISETMAYALTTEPQVAIMNSLAPLLKTEGVLIPEAIELALDYTSYAKEPILSVCNNEYTIKNTGSRYFLKNKSKIIYKIDKNTPKDIEKSLRFETDWFKRPDSIEEAPDICIYTFVQIYKNICLNQADSLITNPYCVGSLYNIEKGAKFKLKYCTQPVPKWNLATLKYEEHFTKNQNHETANL
ncbi:class I SAM-dependent methyltransferase [Aquimarina brevivitae]|uniref:Methyltransferase family protein n=1 Tax=Aquimarina brevivitae TaxID=323412 RepID=A0A4Q7PET6_9FLAO|nr:class I SAM-dependent methyltransferase [Aquimarina brevivitae]RZS98944.1 hypothetical protein EV197_0146 [Aquimarina brevivitae]